MYAYALATPTFATDRGYYSRLTSPIARNAVESSRMARHPLSSMPVSRVLGPADWNLHFTSPPSSRINHSGSLLADLWKWRTKSRAREPRFERQRFPSHRLFFPSFAFFFLSFSGAMITRSGDVYRDIEPECCRVSRGPDPLWTALCATWIDVHSGVSFDRWTYAVIKISANLFRSYNCCDVLVVWLVNRRVVLLAEIMRTFGFIFVDLIFQWIFSLKNDTNNLLIRTDTDFLLQRYTS